VRDEWQQRCNAAGREVIVSEGGGETTRGMFHGIDGDGALLVRFQDGMVERILSGDVKVV
jgi:biotin-(acetyl-CoA carboxylase) ligase